MKVELYRVPTEGADKSCLVSPLVILAYDTVPTEIALYRPLSHRIYIMSRYPYGASALCGYPYSNAYTGGISQQLTSICIPLCLVITLVATYCAVPIEQGI